ncbi:MULTISPECIES: hypothetical protein [Streptosporangium]|uniref:Lipoprotein n=1 Tax=Streptosporangium brasiliense TaxID=47480 RepID=A0ABT9R227_9ACTN|nr:hypothetical protein [Streptosporangium brasiliense]MDP9863267.1 hypothetical protein [Streptosporangium brasiliense]
MGRWLKITLAVVVIMGATACTPPIAGSTGVSVDAAGHPIIVLAWCDGATPEDVIVSHDEPYSGVLGADTLGDHSNLPSITASTHSVEDAEFSAPDLDGQSASVRLDAPTGGWTAEPKPLVLKPGVTYNAFGGKGRGNSRINTSWVSFTAESVARLKPGQVLVQGVKEIPLKTPIDGVDTEFISIDTVISQEKFDREGQDPTNCQ